MHLLVLVEFVLLSMCSQDSSVGIVTHYRLDGPGIESLWGRDFLHPLRPGRWAHPDSYTRGTGSFPGVKQLGRVVDHTPPSSAEVEERVQLYLHSLFGPLWPVTGWTSPLLYLTVEYVSVRPQVTNYFENWVPHSRMVIQCVMCPCGYGDTVCVVSLCIVG